MLKLEPSSASSLVSKYQPQKCRRQLLEVQMTSAPVLLNACSSLPPAPPPPLPPREYPMDFEKSKSVLPPAPLRALSSKKADKIPSTAPLCLGTFLKY